MGILCIDFDGVMNQYKGYAGEDVLYDPQPGIKEFLIKCRKQFGKIIVFTARDNCKVEEWLKFYGLYKYVDGITSNKVPADVYLDDRAIKFDGCFNKALADLNEFKVHWQD